VELQIDRVSKQYRGGVRALDDFTMRLGPGVLGLLGPNGAGKSTLMRILATIARPTAGHVTWNGVDVLRDPDSVRRALGYLPQDFGVYPNLSALEFLRYLAAVRGLGGPAIERRIEELLELTNLAGVKHRPLGSFSGGMRQRVGIAQALLNDPRLVIVDEPTVGLDPEERMRFRSLLGELAGERIVILSTHIVSDVEAAATSIALIAGGRLLAHDAPEALVARAAGRVWEWTIAPDTLADVRARTTVVGVTRRPDGLLVRAVAGEAPATAARPVPPTLEDAYLDAVRDARATALAAR
jgi:ABC-2 type transport system ATP-binding protein